MTIRFTKTADKQLKDWIITNQAVARKIYVLIEDIEVNGLLNGKGKPEKLKHEKNPVKFSRRITLSDRLVYTRTDENILLILSCKGHYDD